MSYPKVDETKRPYRIWHEQEKKQVPYRYYTDEKRAQVGALIECAFILQPNQTVTVWNILTARVVKSYTLRFRNGKGTIVISKPRKG